MAHTKGNNYQNVITGALRVAEETGRLPGNFKDLERSSDLTDEEISRDFASMEALRAGLIDHGLTLLADALAGAAVHADPHDPRDQIMAMSRAFFSWGAENRALFALLGQALLDPKLAKGSVLERHRSAIRDLVLRKLKECQGLGMIPEDADLDLMLASTHSLILGASSMLIYNRLDNWYTPECKNVETLAIAMLDQFFKTMIRPLPADGKGRT